MTEEEWGACGDPEPVVRFLAGTASARKLRLACCACCRRVWELLPVESKVGIEVSERYADALASAADCDDAFVAAEGVALELGRPGGGDALTYATAAACEAVSAASERFPVLIGLTSEVASAAGCAAGERVSAGEYDRAHDIAYKRELGEQVAVLRDIFGNPFRPVTFDREWRTTDVMLLANGIYAERAFDRMPILADALQDAGCDDDILNHCRDANATHVRGCWALDLVLGKV